MRILLDMDEILARWVARILEYYNEDHGTCFTEDDIRNWDVKTNLGPGSEGSIRSYMRYIELYRDLEPVEGAIPGMRKLVDAGHDVVIVTAVPKCAGISFHGKSEWLRRNTPFFSLNNLIACHRKYLVHGDVLFDDGLHNVMPWVRMGRRAVVLDRPWNRQVREAAERYGVNEERMALVHRVSHWNQFLRLVEGWSQETDT